MSDLALQLIAQEKKEKTGKLDLGKCGLTQLPEELFELDWLEELTISNLRWETEQMQWIESTNNGPKNRLEGGLPVDFAKLNKLQSLNIGGHGYGPEYEFLNDVSILSEIKTLTTLDISYNQISDFSFLEKLIGIHTLRISRNLISDIHPLENLNNLISLDLSTNRIKDIQCLGKISTIQYLVLTSNQISDCNCLEKLTDLYTLYLGHNQISIGRGAPGDGTLLTSVNKVINTIHNMTWKGVTPLVAFIHKYYQKGFKLDKRPMQQRERYLIRKQQLPKGNVWIKPSFYMGRLFIQ